MCASTSISYFTDAKSGLGDGLEAADSPHDLIGRHWLSRDRCASDDPGAGGDYGPLVAAGLIVTSGTGRRPADIESSGRRFWRKWGSAGVSQCLPTPLGFKGRCGTPARTVTLRVGSCLASPSGLLVLVRPSAAP